MCIRARHIKCDEGKPTCDRYVNMCGLRLNLLIPGAELRCKSAGRICGGYVSLDRFPAKLRSLAPALAVKQPHSLGSSNSWKGTENTHCLKLRDSQHSPLPPLVDTSQTNLTFQERWFLDFFRHATAQTNATYFNEAFWGMLVHQASEIQPAVRHAVIGIGSLHWSGMMNTNAAAACQIQSFSLRQCSKAHEHLQQNLAANISRRPRMETVLVSCGIMLAFTFSQGDARAGGCHLRAGYKLLYEWQKVQMDKSPIGAVVLESFYQVHLDWPPLVNTDADSKDFSYPLQLATEYQMDVLIETPEEACGILLILGWLVLQMRPQPSTDTPADSAPFSVLQRLRHWKSLILQRGHNLSQARRDTIAILDIWSEVILIKDLTDSRLKEGETRYDDYLFYFQRIVQQSKKLLAQRSLRSSWAASGIVAPLFFCAFKCRDWIIRREALDLLSKQSSEQGIWSISKTSLVLDRLIKIESEGYQPGETIPESARIDGVRVEFLSGEKKVRFRYRQPAPLDLEGNRCEASAWYSEIIPY